MSLRERLYPEAITPGTMSTYRQRHRMWMRLHSVGPIPQWVKLALTAQLRPGATVA